MRKINLFINVFFLTVLIIALSGCQKDPIQPMGGSTKTTHVTLKKTSRQKPAPVTTKKKTESVSTPESTEPKTTTTQNVEKPKVTAPKKVVTTSPQPLPSKKTTNSQVKTTLPQKKPVKQTPVTTVSVAIVGYKGKQILPLTKVPYKKGETVLDATLYSLKENGILYDVTGSGALAYVRGIEPDYEFHHGPKSGWVATKNGIKLTQSAGITSIKANDRIVWRYTTTGE